ncbi:secreted antigen 3 [Babesia divergens]|uniref:Secreted antigen 3 n=1 Tax=Babesia divergens TaxID=32595 RepID=A0AAD9LL78_BABDI|nr:secreted antigen 3 [Babesia divergens]
MKFLGILRVFALFILVSAFHGPRGIFCSNLEVNPSTESFTVEVSDVSENLEDSTVESSSELSSPAPKSALVFENATWDVSQLANTIVFLDEFCKDVKGGKFDAHIPTEKIKKLDKACRWVSYYVDTFSWKQVRDLHENPYEDALKPEKFKDYAKWIVENIPEIKKSMRNMYNEALSLYEKQLETATSSGPYKYGFVCNDDWWKVVGSGWLGGHKGGNPITFLRAIDKLHKRLGEILGDPQCENASIISKVLNFLSREKKSDVNSQQEDSTVESSSELSSPAPKSNLVFENSKWDDSMLASTFLFINEFCKEVKAKKFNEKLSDKKFKDLSKKCANLSSYVGSFIHRFKPTYGPGSVAERQEIPMNFYKDVLKPEDFKLYAKWLVKNIPMISEFVKIMHNKALGLSKEQLNTDTKVDPFIYGFVYTGKPWGELTHGVNRGFFGSNTILESFKDLKSSLDDILGNSITKKILNFFSREKKSDVNSQQENSTVKSQAA